MKLLLNLMTYLNCLGMGCFLLAMIVFKTSYYLYEGFVFWVYRKINKALNLNPLKIREIVHPRILETESILNKHLKVLRQ